MQLKSLIKQANDLRQQRQLLRQQDSLIKQQLADIEAQIKNLANNAGEDYAELSEDEFQMLLAELGDEKRINIEVVYAEQERQIIQELEVPEGATVEDGIVLSGILDALPHIDLASTKAGVFGKVKALSESLQDGDRIELYRPVNNA